MQFKGCIDKPIRVRGSIDDQFSNDYDKIKFQCFLVLNELLLICLHMAECFIPSIETLCYVRNLKHLNKIFS